MAFVSTGMVLTGSGPQGEFLESSYTTHSTKFFSASCQEDAVKPVVIGQTEFTHHFCFSLMRLLSCYSIIRQSTIYSISLYVAFLFVSTRTPLSYNKLLKRNPTFSTTNRSESTILVESEPPLTTSPSVAIWFRTSTSSSPRRLSKPPEFVPTSTSSRPPERTLSTLESEFTLSTLSESTRCCLALVPIDCNRGEWLDSVLVLLFLFMSDDMEGNESRK